MDDAKNFLDEMDEAIRETTGGKPPVYDLQSLFDECQTYQKTIYGGGEANSEETSWLEGIRAREAEIERRRKLLIEETEEVEELDDSADPADEVEGPDDSADPTDEVEGPDDYAHLRKAVEEPDHLARDGIIIRR